MKNQMKLILTYSHELKDLVIKEVADLGGVVTIAGPKALFCEVDEETFYRIHLYNTLPDQIHLHLKTFSAKTAEMIFDQVRRIKWSNWINPEKEYTLKFSTQQDDESSKKIKGVDAQKIFQKVKQGISDSIRHHTGKEVNGSMEGDATIYIHIEEKEKITLSLNTSGRSLHKRGYRQKSHLAPLKENKAQALLQWANYEGKGFLLDPFCGSGTIVIEAAFKALHKAAHIHRPKDVFAFEKLPFFNRQLWKEVQDKARKEKREHLGEGTEIWAFDIDPKIVTDARENSLSARVEKFIRWNCVDFFAIKRFHIPESGMIIANLPYDERLPESDMESFYRRIGQQLKDVFHGYQVYFMVAQETPWKAIGLRPTFTRKINNGAIPCLFVRFDIFPPKNKE